MGAVICPHCNVDLPPREIAEGWCESCGKKIPAWVLGGTSNAPAAASRPLFTESARGGFYSTKHLADRLSRLGAVFLDSSLALLAYVPGLVLVFMASDEHPELAAIGLFVLMATLGVLAITQIVLLSTRGQTLGKKLMGIRIVRAQDGGNPGFVGAVLLRNVVRGLIIMIPIVGPIFALVDILYIFGEERRCLHDYIAGTDVVDA